MSKFSKEHKPNMWWIILLLAPFVGLLWGLFLNRVGLDLPSIASFSWHQFLWVAITALITGAVYLKAVPRLQPIPRKQKRQ
jgi:hypothetical protein